VAASAEVFGARDGFEVGGSNAKRYAAQVVDDFLRCEAVDDPVKVTMGVDHAPPDFEAPVGLPILSTSARARPAPATSTGIRSEVDLEPNVHATTGE